jgi:uracil-DNA glycosylase family 4
MYWDGLRTELATCVRCKTAEKVTCKVLDPLIVLPPFPILFVSEGPGFCEDRTGIPLVGGTELAMSRCAPCKNLKECFKFFLKLSSGYKVTEQHCEFSHLTADGIMEGPSSVDLETLVKRRKAIIKSFARGRPSTAGEMLNELLLKVDLYRGTYSEYSESLDGKAPHPDIVMTNVVHCRPTSLVDGLWSNRKPATVEVSNCRQHLLKVIEVVQPKVIVAAGTPAVQALSKEKLTVTQAMKVSPASIESNVGVPLVPMYHPSYLLRTRGESQGAELGALKRLHAAKKISGLED